MGYHDLNLVVGCLWQGAYPKFRPSDVKHVFDAVVFAAEELQPSPYAFPGITRIYAPNDDSGEPLSAEQWKTARRAALRVRTLLDKGKKVLVTCHAGLNRSGLISGLSLMLPRTEVATDLRTPSCLSSAQAIYLIRKARGPYALSNRAFESLLVSLDGRLCPNTRAVVRPEVLF